MKATLHVAKNVIEKVLHTVQLTAVFAWQIVERMASLRQSIDTFCFHSDRKLRVCIEHEKVWLPIRRNLLLNQGLPDSDQLKSLRPRSFFNLHLRHLAQQVQKVVSTLYSK